MLQRSLGPRRQQGLGETAIATVLCLILNMNYNKTAKRIIVEVFQEMCILETPSCIKCYIPGKASNKWYWRTLKQ